jgi:hypothetical protein
MSEILVVDSYAKTPQQVEALSAAVHALAELGRDLCLVSHLPIPESVLHPGVKYVLYDSHNILGGEPMTLCLNVGDLEVRFQPADYYHGAAVYSNLYNSLRLLAPRYEWVHFVEADIDVEDVRKHLAGGFQEFKNDKDLKVIGYTFFPNDPALVSTAIFTSLISVKPALVEHLPLISSWSEYRGFYQGQAPILEAWLVDRLKAGNIGYTLLSVAQIRHQSNLGGDYHVVKCRQRNSLWAVFVANRSKSMLDAQWRSGRHRQLEPGVLWCVENVAPSDEVSVTFVGSGNVFHHSLETMRPGIFKKAGLDLCPDWT